MQKQAERKHEGHQLALRYLESELLEGPQGELEREELCGKASLGSHSATTCNPGDKEKGQLRVGSTEDQGERGATEGEVERGCQVVSQEPMVNCDQVGILPLGRRARCCCISSYRSFTCSLQKSKGYTCSWEEAHGCLLCSTQRPEHNNDWSWGAAQWQSACLAHRRPWV